jgi:hypothetical protein
MGRMMEMALSGMRVVRGFLDVPRFVMPSRFSMVFRCFPVAFRCLAMVFRGLLRHGVSSRGGLAPNTTLAHQCYCEVNFAAAQSVVCLLC